MNDRIRRADAWVQQQRAQREQKRAEVAAVDPVGQPEPLKVGDVMNTDEFPQGRKRMNSPFVPVQMDG